MDQNGKKKIKANYVDNHPPKGYENWWEEANMANKKAERQRAKKEIREGDKE